MAASCQRLPSGRRTAAVRSLVSEHRDLVTPVVRGAVLLFVVMCEMYRDHSVAVVIPVYNEAQFIGDVLEAVPSFVDRIYAVDDCSTDETWTEIQRYASRVESTPSTTTDSRGVESELTSDGGRREASIVPIRHDTNTGRGGAVKTGYKTAIDAEMDLVAVIDGDGQMDPTILDRFLDPIVAGEAAYTKGNRLDNPTQRAQMSSWRLFGNALLTGLTRIASGYWEMTDPQNGYTAISTAALQELEIDRLYDGYGFLNDMLVHLNVNDIEIKDVPTTAHYGEEESGIEYRSFVPMLTLLLISRYLWRLQLKLF